MAEQIERLAHHARLGELWSKALLYLRQAGAKAAERPAYREAFTLFEQALEALKHLPESRESLEQAIDIRFDIRNVLQPLGDHGRIAGFLREAERLATTLDDPRRVGWIQSYLTDHHWILGRTEEAAAAGERALGIARQLSELPLQVVTNLPLGLLHHTRGDYRRAMRYFEWNVARLDGELLQQRFGLFVLPSSFSRSFIAWSLAELGEFAKGAAIGTEGVRIAETADHAFSCGFALPRGMGVLHLRRGELPCAIFELQRALAVGAFAKSRSAMRTGRHFISGTRSRCPAGRQRVCRCWRRPLHWQNREDSSPAIRCASPVSARHTCSPAAPRTQPR